MTTPGEERLTEESAAPWSVAVGGDHLRSVDIITPDGDVVAEVFGNPAHWETADQRARAICEAHNTARSYEGMRSKMPPGCVCEVTDPGYCPICADKIQDIEAANEGMRKALEAIAKGIKGDPRTDAHAALAALAQPSEGPAPTQRDEAHLSSDGREHSDHLRRNQDHRRAGAGRGAKHGGGRAQSSHRRTALRHGRQVSRYHRADACPRAHPATAALQERGAMMADSTKLKFTQAEVDSITAECDRQTAALKEEHAKEMAAAREEARKEGQGEGVMQTFEWLDDRTEQLAQMDEGRGYFEAEIAILRWAAVRIGAL